MSGGRDGAWGRPGTSESGAVPMLGSASSSPSAGARDPRRYKLRPDRT